MKANLEYIFKDLKDGDCLAFYRKAWYLQLIPFFTRQYKGQEAPQHVAICYEIKRTTNAISFKLSEQTFHGGQYRDIEIFEVNGKYFIEDDYFNKQNKIALLSLKTPMTEKQIEAGIKDAKGQIGRKYGWIELPKSLELLDRILNKRIKNYLYKRNIEENSRHCSKHIQMNLMYSGYYVFKDFNPTPVEITKLPIFNVIV